MLYSSNMVSVSPESMYDDSLSEKDEDDDNHDLGHYLMVGISLLLIILTFPVSWLMCVQVVQEYERLIVFRLGKVRKSGGPGLCLTIPCTDTTILVDMRTGVHDIPTQDILTKDSVAVAVDAVLYYKVSDPMLAVCGDGDYKITTMFKAQSAIRNILGTMTLSEILHGREHLGLEMRDSLQESLALNGVTVDCLELRQVGLPSTMQRSMASEAEANVKSKAKVILSTAEREASQKLVDAGDDLSPVSIHLRYLQSMLKIHRPVEQDMMYVVPLPMDIIHRLAATKLVTEDIERNRKMKDSRTTENVVRRRKKKHRKI